MAELTALRREIEDIETLEKSLGELRELLELASEDAELASGLEKEVHAFERKLQDYEIRASLTGEDDDKNAVLSVHPGAGGTESQDWAQMLLRMYLKWLDKSPFRYRVVDIQPAEEAGIKDATILVEGKYAYGYLKAERGVHRLVRISPFDASSRRHTSFASVFVTPESEDIQVEIKDEDLKIETFRSSGPGGQHMQKTESAVRIVHLPTRIVVTCQSERSQYQNKQTALRVLRSRLYELQKEQERERQRQMKSEMGQIAWGNQIRSYVLHPYKMVKDHRTGYEVSQAEWVLEGNIDEFIRRFLLMKGT